jgi:hypothetical protein
MEVLRLWVLCNLIAAPTVDALGLQHLLLLELAIVGIEWPLLSWLAGVSSRCALLISLFANIASCLPGIFFSFGMSRRFASELNYWVNYRRPQDEWTAEFSSSLEVLAASFVITLIIEYFVLIAFSRTKPRLEIMRTTLLVHLISYPLLIIAIYGLTWREL